jgi:hypothetical protein
MEGKQVYVINPAKLKWCHGRISAGERYVGTVAGRIGYRAINVQESNPVAGSMDKT